ncbi:MAG: N-acetylmuramoyl-L-alanine amidase [Planctomycetes bacterium]|nr:N-acetylmuramoyl-L-alanine amidase [Planctomycetota bacterium]
MNRRFWAVIPWLLALVIGSLTSPAGCRRQPEEKPSALGVSPSPAAAEPRLPPYARHLAGTRICLDPGHGGDAARANYKRGPSGLREAEVNLRVALFLRDLLEASGATVFMTRTTDTCLANDDEEDLRLRAEVANRNDCDVLLSIHHNASDERAEANFTSVWYHGQVDHSPASLDVAREVAAALLEELPLPERLGVPVLSDQLIYPRSGFRLLRLARVPAVLSEASFHTNRAEEQRLRDPDYNRREARALFIGLARYALGGVPRARLIEPAGGRVPASGSARVVLELDDGLRSRKSWGWQRRMILKDSIAVRVGDGLWPFTYDEQSGRVSLYLPTTRQAGPLTLGVQFENLFKHSNTRPWLTLQVTGPG